MGRTLTSTSTSTSIVIVVAAVVVVAVVTVVVVVVIVAAAAAAGGGGGVASLIQEKSSETSSTGIVSRASHRERPKKEWTISVSSTHRFHFGHRLDFSLCICISGGLDHGRHHDWAMAALHSKPITP